jgi:integrase/recombinase XerD
MKHRLIRRSLPLSEWPSGDRVLWAALFQPRRSLGDGPRPRFNDRTRKKFEYAYGRWLQYLALRRPELLALSPGDRPELTVLEGWYDTLEGLAPLSVWSYFDSLAASLKLICPRHDWSQLREVVNRLRANANPLKSAEEKAYDADWLYGAGLAYMEKVDTAPEHRHLMGSSAYRDGLLVAFLAACPIRRRALSELTVSRHLVRTDEGYVVWEFREDVKCDDGSSFPVPPSLVPYLDRYLEFHRPRLLQGNHSEALWVTREGRALSYGGFGHRFEKATPKIVGARISMHSFRHSAATSLVAWDAKSASQVQHLLAQKSREIGEKHYIARNRSEAKRAHQANLSRLRKLGPREPQ